MGAVRHDNEIVGHEGHLGCRDAEGGGGHLGDRGADEVGGEGDDKGTDGSGGDGDGGRVGAVGYDNMNVGHMGHPGCMDAGGGGGHLCDRGVGGDGGEGDGGRVGAIGLMCNVSECNIEMRRSIETGRTRLGLNRTGATSPWRRTRSSTPSRRSLTRGGTRGTSSNLSSAAFILGATEVQDHRFLGMTGAQKQTILVEKAFLGQSDGKRCR